MQKIIQLLPIIVVAVAIGLITNQIVERRREKAAAKPSITVAEKVNQLPMGKELSKADRELAERAFQSPEELDASRATNTLVAVQPPKHGTLLSEIEPETSTNRSPAGDDQYFQKDFESLRTDAVKNPDSEQNRETVRKIMQMRQQRLNGE